ALKAASGEWNLDNFAKFVLDPGALFKGAKMGGIQLREAETKALYTYLEAAADPKLPVQKTTETEPKTVAVEASKFPPFEVPFAAGSKRLVKAYEELTPGFWIGFDESKGSS